MRDDDFLTVQEAVDRYRVSRRTIEWHIKAGRIPVTRIDYSISSPVASSSRSTAALLPIGSHFP